jgi:16S rRNA G966 N2-methylase RsmD
MRNAAACGFASQASAVTASALDALQRPTDYNLHGSYDIISLTPPYLEVSYPDLLRAACESPLVKENTLLVVEYPTEMGAQPYILGEDRFFGVRSRRYGRTILAVYVYRPTMRFDLRPDEFV